MVSQSCEKSESGSRLVTSMGTLTGTLELRRRESGRVALCIVIPYCDEGSCDRTFNSVPKSFRDKLRLAPPAAPPAVRFDAWLSSHIRRRLRKSGIPDSPAHEFHCVAKKTGEDIIFQRAV